MQNQTKARSMPLVRRRSVIPKLILESVDAKHESDATAVTPRAMVARLGAGTSRVRLPKPSWTPIWVVIASVRRKIWCFC
jgi:hypothetical protein